MKIFNLIIGICLSSLYGSAQTTIPASEIRKHTSDSISTSEKIFGGRIIEHNQVTILYIGAQFPEQLFTIQIKEPARGQLKLKHPDELKGRKIKVTGKVVELGGKPSIIITDPRQLHID